MSERGRSGFWIATGVLLVAIGVVAFLSNGTPDTEPRAPLDATDPTARQPPTAEKAASGPGLPSGAPHKPAPPPAPKPPAPPPPLARLVGRVVDSTDAPLPGAAVRLATRGEGAGQLAAPLDQADFLKSGAQGDFGFDGVAANQAHYLIVSSQGRHTVWRGPFAPAPGEVLDVGRVRLPAGGTVAGVVRDLDGAPLVGALVDEYFPLQTGAATLPTDAVVSLPDQNPASVLTPALRRRLRIGRQRLTDADGAFTFIGLARGPFVVRARAKGYAPVAMRVLVSVKDPVRLDLSLPAASGHIEGRVEDEYGRPLSGAFVHAAPSGSREASDAPERPAPPPGFSPVACDLPQANGRTGDDGSYHLTGLAGSRFHVSVSAFDHLPAERSDVTSGATRVDFSLAQAGRLEGRVVDAHAHKPVPDALVEAFELDPDGFTISVHGQRGRAPPEAKGSWILTGLRPGTYRVVGRAPGFAESRTEAIVLRASEIVRDITLALSRGGSVEGRIVAARDGSALAGVHLQLDNRERHPPAGLILPEAGVRTDAAGHFRLEHLPAGSIHLMLEHPDYVADPLAPIHVREGARLRGFVIKMWKAAVIEGHVQGAPGRSAATRVRLTHVSSGGERTASCDVEGRFLFTRLLPGRYSLSVVGGSEDTSDEGRIRLLDLEESARVEVELEVAAPGDR